MSRAAPVRNAAIGLTFAALIALAAPSGVEWVKGNEGRSLTVYSDGGGVLTQCDGETDLSFLPQDRPATPEECDKLTDRRFREYGKKVWDLLYPEAQQALTVSRFIAYTDFSYQYGVKAFKNSTMRRLANEGMIVASCFQFDRWGKVKTTLGGADDRRDRNGGFSAPADGLKDCGIRRHQCYGVYDRAQRNKEKCLNG